MTLAIFGLDSLSPAAIANATHPVLHVAVKLPGRRYYLDADGLSAHDALLNRFRRSRPRDNPFFISYDPNFFRFSGIRLWGDVAETLAERLAGEFADFETRL